jgi:hypothetical protein
MAWAARSVLPARIHPGRLQLAIAFSYVGRLWHGPGAPSRGQMRATVDREKCFHFAIGFELRYGCPVKTIPLTVRRVPQAVHEALKKSAKANKRSLNNEVLTLLERQSEQPVLIPAREAARILANWKSQFKQEDMNEIARLTEEYVEKTRREPHHH